ncbi:MAG TPA: amino acid permease [Spirochaetota bacterium]|nr:amino acid permease [Spirochaetota bacterium]HPC40548.1 amino acid permease [Spirochaetota bacterium]HPL17533.1 amino acid permease [Spirochaetota bacterium]HQF07944.1 amino acid permease [Spirochaetota bacterium]HQH96504.1 amino acid permease [Spirochaetota bacterium]
MELKRQIGLVTAMMIIIADVIGTGIFMTTGEVLGMTGSAVAVLVLFGIGGVIALTGSLCYAELATMWPEDGGEYVYLKKIYGHLPSFLSGWISLIIGFSLAASMSAITAVNYVNKLSPEGIFTGSWLPKFVAAGIIVFFSMIHLIGVQKGSLVQNILTILKLLVVFLFIALGFYFADWSTVGRLSDNYQVGDGSSVFKWGSALIIIMYAYSGWNGTTYIAGEIRDPDKNLPRALFLGTLLITVIYLAMNVVYLMSAPGDVIMTEGKYTIGALAAKNLFGPNIGPVFDASIVLILLSSVSVQMMIGPRVTFAMAKDRTIFGSLGRVNLRFQTPDLAIVVQMVIAVFYVFIGFDAILKMLIYMGFALSIFPLMTVIGMVYTRIKKPELARPFRVPLFPLIPLIYITLMIAVIITTLIEKTVPSLFAVGVVLVGIVIFFIRSRIVKE